jgi:hypothetical protein
MFSIVIPTIWVPDISNVDSLINKLSQCELISEIILINNNPQKYQNRYHSNLKIKELKYNNIYVNPSWNVGVYQSNNEFVCLLSDDVDFNMNIFDFIHNAFKSEDVKICGASKSSYTLQNDHEFSLQKVTIRNRGWGCIIFVKKSAYTWIPNDLKIHFGDDYLIKQLVGYVWKFEGLKITSRISTSIDSNPEFEKIIQEDNRNSIKYDLPWSNDY